MNDGLRGKNKSKSKNRKGRIGMELKNLLSEAEKYKEEIVADRRALHQNPEV